MSNEMNKATDMEVVAKQHGEELAIQSGTPMGFEDEEAGDMITLNFLKPKGERRKL